MRIGVFTILRHGLWPCCRNSPADIIAVAFFAATMVETEPANVKNNPGFGSKGINTGITIPRRKGVSKMVRVTVRTVSTVFTIVIFIMLAMLIANPVLANGKKHSTKPSAKSIITKSHVQPIGLNEALQTVLSAWHSPASGDDYPLKGLVDTFGPATKHTSNVDDSVQGIEFDWKYWYFQSDHYYVVLVSFHYRHVQQYIVRIYPFPNQRKYDFTVKEFQGGIRAAIAERDAEHPGYQLTTVDGTSWQKYLVYGKGIGADSDISAIMFDGSFEVGAVAQVDSTVWNNRDADGIIYCCITSPAWKLGSKKVLNSQEGKYEDVPDSTLWEYAATDNFLEKAKVSSITICYPASAVDFQSVAKLPDLTKLKTDTCPWTDASILAEVQKSWKMGLNRDCNASASNVLHEPYDPKTHTFPLTVDCKWSGYFGTTTDRVPAVITLVDGAWQLVRK